MSDITLSSVCIDIFDCEHKTAPTSKSGYPSVRTPNIGRGFIIFNDLNLVDEDTYRAWTRRAVPQKDDIIFAREAPVGNAIIIPENFYPCLGQRTVLIRPNSNVVNPQYLLYNLLGNEMQAQIHSLTNGATVHHLNVKDIKSLRMVKLHERAQQDKIAKTIATYDNLIENNNRRIAVLEEMAQRLYREWFVHFRFPGHENVELVDSELGMIPEGWRVSDVEGNCSVLRRGMSPVYNDNAEGIVINQKCIRDFSINLELARNQEKTFPAELQVRNGDVLINSTGVGTLGRVAQMYENVPNCTVDSHITLLRPDSNISYYVGNFFREKQASIMDMGVGSTGQTELNRDKIKVLPLLLPDHDTVCQHEKYVGNLMSLKTQIQKKNMILRKTRDHLLPRLISGDIDVSMIEV